MDKLKEITGGELLEAILKETGDEYRDTMVSKYGALLSAFPSMLLGLKILALLQMIIYGFLAKKMVQTIFKAL